MGEEFSKGRAAVKAGKGLEAVEHYKKAAELAGVIKDTKRQAHYYYDAGYNASRIRGNKEYIELYKKSIEAGTLGGHAALSMRQLGNIYFRQKKYAEAKALFEKFLEEPAGHPSWTEAIKKQLTFINEQETQKEFNRLYTLARKTKNRDEAVAIYTKAIEATKSEKLQSKAYYAIGLTLRYKKVNESIEAFTKAATLPNGDPGMKALSWRLLGMNYMGLKEYDKAKEAFKNYLAKPAGPKAWQEAIKKSLKEIEGKEKAQ